LFTRLIRLHFLVALLLFCGRSANSSPATDPSENVAWLRYLQFQTSHFSRGHSSITTKEFFFSDSGAQDPRAELTRSVQAFRSRERKTIGGEDQPLRCWFPARAELLEKLTGERFPEENCTEIKRWQEAFGQEKISVIFASFYANNPASLFGHTLLRFSQSSLEDRSDKLRTYSAGFLAATDPRDNQGIRMVKGLSGFYDGFYNVKPQYMNAALYANAESRDLWEYPLRLTPAEVHWGVLYLWELAHFGAMPYYFADWNCSYRLLTFIEALRPSLQLSVKSNIFVLPLDTIRTLDQAGLVDWPGVSYEPSLRRRMNAKLAELPREKRAQFRKARTDLSVLEQINDAATLDALIDFWSGKNYDQETKLSTHDRELFDRTLKKRAALSSSTHDDTESLRPKVDPAEGHKTSWLEAQEGPKSVAFSTRMGAHDLRSSSAGYDDFAAIEYLGLDADIDTTQGLLQSADLLFGDVAALNPWSLNHPAFSWRGNGLLRFDREHQDSIDSDSPVLASGWKSWLDIGGGVGASFDFLQYNGHNHGLFYILPGVRLFGSVHDVSSDIGLGLDSGFRWEESWGSLLVTETLGFFRTGRSEETAIRFSKFIGVNQIAYADFHHRRWPWSTVADEDAMLGFRFFY
jgi:hypothetical protein